MYYADSSFLIALLDPWDQWHAEAKHAAPALMRRAWRTHSLALGEVAAVIGSRRGGKLARDAYQRIRDTIEVEVPTLAQMDLAMRQVVRSNGQLSLADGLFANQVTAADDAAVLSFDMDFDRFGIRRLPER